MGLSFPSNGRHMARLTKRLTNRLWGIQGIRNEGYRRSLKGLRESDYRELSLGLALYAISYLRTTAPKKELIYRKTVAEGSALVIHHAKRGTPRLEIRKP